MGMPDFLTDDLLSEWLYRAHTALMQADVSPVFNVYELWSEFSVILTAGTGTGPGIRYYLESVWENNRPVAAERLFWEFAEANCDLDDRYSDAFEIVKRVEDVEVDEWGV